MSRQAAGPRLGRRLIALAGIALLLATVAQAGSAFAHGRRGDSGAHEPYARSSSTLDGSDTAHLEDAGFRTHEHGGTVSFLEEGSAKGVLSGTMRAKLTFGSVFTASFTIDTKHGSVTAHGSGKSHNRGVYESFSGTMQVTGGSGRYKHIHGSMTLSGTLNRTNYHMTLHTRGRLFY